MNLNRNEKLLPEMCRISGNDGGNSDVYPVLPCHLHF